MLKHKGTAIWKGKGVNGQGTLSTESKVLNNTKYTYKARIGEEKGTTPEELIAAAHAGCFAMKLAYSLDMSGYTADLLEVECEIDFEGSVIKASHLKLKAKVPGIEKEEFDEIVNDSGRNCPVSLMMRSEVTFEAQLL